MGDLTSTTAGDSTVERRHGTTVIVGPGEHFGSDLVAAFARFTSTVVIVGRHDHTLRQLAANLGDKTNVVIVVADVTDVRFGDTLRGILQPLPPLRYLVYNVKQSPRGPALHVDISDFNAAFDANVGGALAVVQVAASVAHETPVTCILTGGGFKDVPDESRLALSVSKAGLHSLALALNPALRSRGVAVKTLVIDGYVREGGPIRPSAVADAMVALAQNPKRFVARVEPNSPKRAPLHGQLGLFDEVDQIPV